MILFLTNNITQILSVQKQKSVYCIKPEDYGNILQNKADTQLSGAVLKTTDKYFFAGGKKHVYSSNL